MLEELIKHLNNIYPLSPGLIKDIWDFGQIKEYKKDDLILKEGGVANYTSYVLKGAVRSYYLKDDEEITTKFLQEGSYITSTYSYFSRKPGNENIIALEDVTLACYHYDHMQQMYKNHLEFNIHGRKFTELYLYSAEIELYNLRKTKAEDRYRYFVKHYPQLLQRAPLKHIATYLGMSLETLSRIRAQKK